MWNLETISQDEFQDKLTINQILFLKCTVFFDGLMIIYDG